MKLNIPVGGENFEELRQDGCYYVDKTALLYELVQEKRNKVTLFTRPRRFGKTLMMRMIESFFDIRRDSRAVFAGLEITNHEDFCREWMNQYPVLMVSFKDVEALRFSTAYEKLKAILAEAFQAHGYLETSGRPTAGDKEIFSRLLRQRGTDSDVQGSLRTVVRMLQAHYGKPVILLIDEYDVPMAKANEPKRAASATTHRCWK